MHTKPENKKSQPQKPNEISPDVKRSRALRLKERIDGGAEGTEAHLAEIHAAGLKTAAEEAEEGRDDAGG